VLPPSIARSGQVGERREKNKEERRERILRATFELFAEKGFDKATTREIAKRAGVAAGTIFLYAQDKVDLCLMSINDDLDKLTDNAFAEIDDDQPLIDQIIQFFRPRYVFWARYPKLSRAAAREMATIYSQDEPSRERARGIARRAHTLEKLSEIIRRAVGRRELARTLDFESFARIIYDIFLMEFRFWLSNDPPVVEKGVEKFRFLISLVLSNPALLPVAKPRKQRTPAVRVRKQRTAAVQVKKVS
jgi:AcrR family transcriptional regulator